MTIGKTPGVRHPRLYNFDQEIVEKVIAYKLISFHGEISGALGLAARPSTSEIAQILKLFIKPANYSLNQTHLKLSHLTISIQSRNEFVILTK